MGGGGHTSFATVYIKEKKKVQSHYWLHCFTATSDGENTHEATACFSVHVLGKTTSIQSHYMLKLFHVDFQFRQHLSKLYADCKFIHLTNINLLLQLMLIMGIITCSEKLKYGLKTTANAGFITLIMTPLVQQTPWNIEVEQSMMQNSGSGRQDPELSH